MSPNTFLMIYKFSKNVEPGVFIGKLSDEIPEETWELVGTYTEYGEPIIKFFDEMNKRVASLSSVYFILITDGSGPCRERDEKAVAKCIAERIEDWRSKWYYSMTKLNMLIITDGEVFHWGSEPI